MGTLMCFKSCIAEPPQPPRRRIDRTMISNPTNFRHTTHVGSGDLMTNGLANKMSNIQDEMSSKGECSNSGAAVEMHFNMIDLPVRRLSSNSFKLNANS